MENLNINYIEGGVCAPKGFKAAGVHAGIRKNKSKNDLALIASDEMCSVAAAFTTNKVKGAPITVSKNNMKDGRARAVICNSGNANTCAPNGIEIAEKTCEILSENMGIDKKDILIASTGVIGEMMTIEPFEKAIPKLVKELDYDSSAKAAEAIMTTDTVKKEVAVEFTIDGKLCKLGGIAKGSGMINPKMATMLSFLTTDVAISSTMLQQALSCDIKDSFNQISIDGDTSTNDTVILLANAMAGNKEIDGEGKDFSEFKQALKMVTEKLSKEMAKDGEGATKLIECIVSKAPDKETARIVAKSVIGSNLFKAAIFGQDANWGRVLCAVGYAEGDFDIEKISVTLASKEGSVLVCKDAAYSSYDENEASKILSADEIEVLISLNEGNEEAVAWGCDLTYKYVEINGDYRS